MSAVLHSPTRTPPHEIEPFSLDVEAAPVVEATSFAGHEIHRWVAVLATPFVLGAVFLALAIGLDAEWPMAPAFLLGPLVLISGYIYLSLTSEANRE